MGGEYNINKSNQIPSSWRYDKKNTCIAEDENPFTRSGLINAFIQDLNDIRHRIEFIENCIISQNNYNKFIFKEWKTKENFLND